ncbi:nuclear pore complex protein NUP93B-like [Zingiber officinale]|uniref:nuclear pore complex protein NUP93B-like n=1 Tax=Zingiber officinale TaxID=94328 RepID=UPI001C4DAD56|nr:nuclear pore complex protein NUP93B-like [Zingiber officinale]
MHALVGEYLNYQHKLSRKMILITGARLHLEWGHEKYILDTIKAHPAQAALGGAVGNLEKIQTFLQVRLRDHRVLDFDAGINLGSPQLTQPDNSKNVEVVM